MKKDGIKFPEKVEYTTELPIGIYHINYGNHLGHDSLVSLIHEARIQYLKKHGYSEIDIEKKSMVVIHLEVFYKKPGFHGDKLTFSIAIGQVGHASVELFYLVKNQNGDEICRASTTHVFADDKHHIVNVPDFFKR